jgi:processive 1,2-diacylglycerol beta-glucosyltransferase
VTDYKLHSWWVAKCTDAYVVADEEAKQELIDWRVRPELVKVLGIPIEPVFSRKLDRGAIFSKTGLKDGVFTVLVIGGGFGVGPIEDIAKEVGKVSAKVQMVVICGHNQELAGRIEALGGKIRCDIKVLGFVDNVYEYMEISDVLISKSGGITVSESLAKELPMIVISPIIGQETRNCEFLVKHHAAFRVSRVEDVSAIVEDLAAHPDKLKAMKDSIRPIKKPMACFDVAKLALEMADGKCRT